MRCEKCGQNMESAIFKGVPLFICRPCINRHDWAEGPKNYTEFVAKHYADKVIAS